MFMKLKNENAESETESADNLDFRVDFKQWWENYENRIAENKKYTRKIIQNQLIYHQENGDIDFIINLGYDKTKCSKPDLDYAVKYLQELGFSRIEVKEFRYPKGYQIEIKVPIVIK